MYSAISLFSAVPAILRNLPSAASPHPRRSHPPAPTSTATSGALPRARSASGARAGDVACRRGVRPGPEEVLLALVASGLGQSEPWFQNLFGRPHPWRRRPGWALEPPHAVWRRSARSSSCGPSLKNPARVRMPHGVFPRETRFLAFGTILISVCET